MIPITCEHKGIFELTRPNFQGCQICSCGRKDGPFISSGRLNPLSLRTAMAWVPEFSFPYRSRLGSLPLVSCIAPRCHIPHNDNASRAGSLLSNLHSW
jgi:hypothetical protein